jgi:hypothetical protein
MRRSASLLISAAVLACLPASASAVPRASDFELRVGDAGPARSAAHAASASRARPWTSPVLRPGRAFSVFGLRWKRAPEDLHAEVRVRDASGWHQWVELPHGHSRRGSDPVWAGRRATALQLRLSARVRGLKVEFVQVRGKARTARRASGPRARAAQNGPPPIISRAEWGGDTQCKPRDTPSLGTVQMAFVHHTVNANDYGPGDSAAMVLGICRFHRNSNGWDDVGYNFFVDKYGQIFEGRAGGIDQPVVGAQAQGWNAQSTGVANLGTYSSVAQTPQAIDAMASLLAWKLPLHGAPVTGTVTLKSAGGSTNRYANGTLHTFQRISGHRDGNQTECPGAQLYAQLPGLRALAEQRAPDVIPAPQPVTASARLTLTAVRRALSYPEPAQLAGRLTTPDGAPIGGQLVRIQVLTARGFKAVSSVTTGPDGAFTASLPTSRNRSVRALVGRVVSNTVRLRVAPAMELRKPPKRVLAGRRADLRGKLRPRKGSVTVDVYREAGKRYVFSKRMKVKARRGSFRAAVRLVRPGLYRLRVRFAGDKRNAPGRTDHYVRAVRTRAGLTSGAEAPAD